MPASVITPEHLVSPNPFDVLRNSEDDVSDLDNDDDLGPPDMADISTDLSPLRIHDSIDRTAFFDNLQSMFTPDPVPQMPAPPHSRPSAPRTPSRLRSPQFRRIRTPSPDSSDSDDDDWANRSTPPLIDDDAHAAIMANAVQQAMERAINEGAAAMYQPPCLFDSPPGEQDGAPLPDDAPPWEHLGPSCRPEWWHYWEERHNVAAAAGQASAAALLLEAGAAAAAALAAAQLPPDPLMFPSLAHLQALAAAQDAEDGIVPEQGDDEAPPPEDEDPTVSPDYPANDAEYSAWAAYWPRDADTRCISLDYQPFKPPCKPQLQPCPQQPPLLSPLS